VKREYADCVRAGRWFREKREYADCVRAGRWFREKREYADCVRAGRWFREKREYADCVRAALQRRAQGLSPPGGGLQKEDLGAAGLIYS
jgi:hypothetical protein